MVELTGSDVSSESSEALVEALRRNSHLLSIDIEGIGHGKFLCIVLHLLQFMKTIAFPSLA